MLSPEQIEEAGERVATVYREIEARMLDHLARAMAEGWGKSPRTVTEAALLAQSQAGELRRMVEEFRPSIDAAVLEVMEECLEASDEDDVARAGGSPMWPAQIDATVRGMAEVLARDNIQMAEGAKQAFLNASIEAVTRVNSGDADREAALHRAVRKLERDGIDVVTYQDASTGRATVRNKADVAVRRHVRTQIVQDAQRMTMARMERLGIDLVEVSSHSDARESHAEWQGQCYSLKGEQVIDGVRYPDFYMHCMSGDLGDILGGVNCRHSYGPYRHGAPRMYEPDPQHPSGLPGAEVYELEQGQRYRERKIREAKRELSGAQLLYKRDKSAANLAECLKAKQQLQRRQEKMREYIDGANAKSKTGRPVLHRKPDREWAGDMPKSKMPASANRTLPQLLGTPSARRAMAGLDRRAVTAAVEGEMRKRGGTAADFWSLTAGEQQTMLRGAIAGLRAKLDGTTKANAGRHVAIKEYVPCATKKAALRFAREELGFQAVSGSLTVGELNEINAALYKLIQENPFMKGFVRTIKTGKMHACACFTANRVNLGNGEFSYEPLFKFDRTSLASAAKDCRIFCAKDESEVAWWTQKHDASGIVAHEFAHAVEYRVTMHRLGFTAGDTLGLSQVAALNKARGSVSREIAEAAFRRVGIEYSDDNVARHISMYGTKNTLETLAEALSCEDRENAVCNAIKDITRELLEKEGLL